MENEYLEMKKVKRKLGKYEVGRTIGEGTFAKVKFARNTENGENVAIKVLAKSTILKHRMVEQVLKYTSFLKTPDFMLHVSCFFVFCCDNGGICISYI